MGTSCKTRPEAQFPIRLTKAALVGVVVTLADSVAAFAHSGDTDSRGGHHCNVGSCAGTYHYHNGGGASPVPTSAGGSSSGGAALLWDWFPLLALLGLAAWFFWFRPQAKVARIHAKAERDRLERQTYPHLTAMKELRKTERAAAKAARWADEVEDAQRLAEQASGLDQGDVLGEGPSVLSRRAVVRRVLRRFRRRFQSTVFRLLYPNAFRSRSDD